MSIKRTVCEGNYVVLRCHQVWPGGDEYAGIDIFRLDSDGKIVEHRGVFNQLPLWKELGYKVVRPQNTKGE